MEYSDKSNHSEAHEVKRGAQSAGPAVPAALAAVILLGALMRLDALASESAWFDEVLSLRPQSASSLVEYWKTMARQDPPATVAPVYFTLEYIWTRLAGDSVFGLRLLSVMLSVSAIPLVYIVGRRLYEPFAGGVAALCLAMSLVHIFYAQEIRMYALFMFLAAASSATLTAGLDTGARRWWLLHILVNALLLWTHLFSGLFIFAEGLFIILFYRHRRREAAFWILCHIGLALLALNWVAWLKCQGFLGNAFWTPLPTYRELANMFVIFAGGRFSNESPTPYLKTHFSLDLGLAFFLMLLLVKLILNTLRRAAARRHNTAQGETGRKHVTALALSMSLLCVPPLCLFVASYAYNPVFLYRYLLPSSLALYLTVGGAMATFKNPSVRAGLVIALVSVYAYQYLMLPKPFRPDYEAAAKLVQKNGTPYDLVVTFKKINTVAFQYAADIPESRQVGINGFRELKEKVVAVRRTGRNVWVLMWRWDNRDEFERHLKSHHVPFVVTSLGGMPRLYVYYIAGMEDELPGPTYYTRLAGGAEGLCGAHRVDRNVPIAAM